MTGGRLKRVRSYVGDETFLLHLRRRRGRRRHRAARSPSTARTARLATVTAVRPPGRFGALEIDGDARAQLSARSPRATAAGSTAASSCSSPRVVRLHRRRPHHLGARAAGAPCARRAARAPTSTTASGSRWTRCATRTTSRSLWSGGSARGRCGNDRTAFWRGRRVLAHRPHGLQGRLARALAARARRRRHGLLARPAAPSPSLFESARRS